MDRFRDRLALRIAAAATALVLSFVVVIGIGTWSLAAGTLRAQVDLLLQAQASLAVERASGLISTIDGHFRALIGAAATLESAIPLSGGTEVDGLAVLVLVVDADGRPLAGTRGPSIRAADPWLAHSIGAGDIRGRVRTDLDPPALEMVLPGRSSAWGVVWRLPLQALVERLSRGLETVAVSLGDGRIRVSQHRGGVEDALRVERTIALPGTFAETGLVLEVTAEPALLRAPLERLTALFLAVGTVTPLVAVIVALIMGRRLTAALARLADVAGSFAFGGGDRSAFHTDGTDEIARLGAAFAGTVERLDRAYQEMERRGRTLLSNTERVAQIGSATWDPAGETQVWSDQFYAVLGLDPADNEAGRSAFFHRVHPDDRLRLEAALADEHGRVVEDFRLIRPDGALRVAQLRAELARGSDGRPLRLDVTIQDISERKHLEDRLDALVGELKRSNEELEQFAYVASHDLRQPLRTVRSYISLIEEALDEKLDGETREFMDFIRDGVKRMDALITDLLAYSRVGRVGKEGPVDTGRAVDLALLDLQSQIDEAKAQITVPERMPVITGEAGEMARLFQNLVGNAVKYRAVDRQPVVDVGYVERSGEWEFFVRDNGIGIPEEHAERIFGIFQRLHARHEYEGTGIGLAICRKIIERQGGRIWANATGGQGAEFRFTWPKLRRAEPVTE
jgi:PAS domain S-box-containing protein